MTAKIYPISVYRLKKELKQLRDELDACMKHGETVGFNWLDHYTIRELHSKIRIVKQKIQDEQERPS